VLSTREARVVYIPLWEARVVYIPLWEARREAYTHPGRLEGRYIHTLGG